MNTLPRLLIALVLSSFVSGLPVSAEEPAGEASEVPPSVLKRFDKNKDGALDEAERAKWEEEKAARREKYRAERAELLEKHDANKDGRISEEEKAAAKLEWQKERTAKEAERMKERAAKEKAEAEEARLEAEKKAAAEGKPTADPTMAE